MEAFAVPDNPRVPFHLTIFFETADEARAFYAIFNCGKGTAHKVLGDSNCDKIRTAMGSECYSGYGNNITADITYEMFYSEKGIGRAAGWDEK
jgi:hypothetical protein